MQRHRSGALGGLACDLARMGGLRGRGDGQRVNPSSYASLPERFFARVAPTPILKPRLVKFNHVLAEDLNLSLDGLDTHALGSLFSGNVLPPGAIPIAMAYAGHQFGHFVPQLGDGRAILLGEMRDHAGVRRDIQLKGCGRTPYSRSGDGRAALGPVLREYLVSEAMHALGVPATRSLAAVTTGESVRREALLPGAILTRVAASHVRVGSFEYFAARGDVAAIQVLADYVIERHYAHVAQDRAPYLALLAEVVSRAPSWMHSIPRLSLVQSTSAVATRTPINRMPRRGISLASPRRCCPSSTPTRAGRSNSPQRCSRLSRRNSPIAG
jgi:uncharacterized protein YdiU (UPF0061 family)